MNRITKYSNDVIRNTAINVLRKLSAKNRLKGDELAIIDAFCLIERTKNRKLKEYEDLHDQGRLLELPCAVGDTVWTNSSMKGWYFREKDKPYKAMVVFIGINGKESFMNVDFGNGHMLQFNFSDIGKHVFLAEAEAQKALEGKAE